LVRLYPGRWGVAGHALSLLGEVRLVRCTDTLKQILVEDKPFWAANTRFSNVIIVRIVVTDNTFLLGRIPKIRQIAFYASFIGSLEGGAIPTNAGLTQGVEGESLRTLNTLFIDKIPILKGFAS
jgi:hypothetical protein